MASEDDDVNISIYQQYCEFHRYQDRLMWSRFQTLALVEGAVLYSLYKLQLNLWEQRIFMLFGFLLVLIICLISIKDRIDSKGHLKLIQKFEKEHGWTFPGTKWPTIINGGNMMMCAIFLVNLFNLFIIISYWYKTIVHSGLVP